MDKILLFNGCSFTAGDGLAWDQFCQDFSWRDLVITRSAIKNNKISDKEAEELYYAEENKFNTTTKASREKYAELETKIHN